MLTTVGHPVFHAGRWIGNVILSPHHHREIILITLMGLIRLIYWMTVKKFLMNGCVIWKYPAIKPTCLSLM